MTKKVFVLPPRERWVCDRFVEEFNEHNADIATQYPVESDVIWLLSDWCWNHLPRYLLKQKKVVTTIHHIVPDKFSTKQMNEFMERDSVTDAYHVPCQKTHEQIRTFTTKPIHVQPFWVNNSLWKRRTDTSKQAARQRLGLDKDSFYVMSAQRDTEGDDLFRPKLEKGPDQLCDIIEKLSLERKDVKVLLGGWRRQYVMKRLEDAKIEHKYLELPKFDTLIDMYHASDLYIVAARYEGGPQSIVECAAMDVPIVSTDVGLATEILHENCVIKDVTNWESILTATTSSVLRESLEFNQDSVNRYYIPRGFDYFRGLLEAL